MKRKIFSLFLALVLVVTFSLVTAVPVAAQDPTPTVTFVPGGATGTAAWSDEQQHSDLRSAKMTTTDPNDRGMVRFEFEPGELTLDDLTTLSYWEYVSARENPLDVFIDIWLDFDGDGDADEADYPGYMQAEPLYTVGAAPLDTWTQIDAMNLKWSTYVGPDDPYHAPTISDFQANASEPCVHHYTMADWNGGVDFGPLSILRIDVRVGYGGTWANFTGYADDIVINSYTQGFEPLDEVWVDDNFGPSTTIGWGYDSFATIQDGIDAVAEAGTVNVLAGTYEEDVTISADLTLEGAQVGVDARGRTGDESEIVGVVVVTSDAANVGIDGFTLTSPTREFTPRGFNLGVESESSTIRNNILVAEENAGHVPYGSYLTFQDITNALVEQNSFSGHLDLTQEPNVILFYGIAAGGVVTVQNNEMHDCGGGGGVGIMCNNADAVVNIDGNVIENTGNECIWVWNPGVSAFDTLSITSNDLSEATQNGIKFVAPVTGVVSVSGNEFRDNPVQVLDLAEILDIQGVLDTNDFDRAVVVDNPGSSLLPTIWSSIQDAVNAAVAGDTVDVAAGTYPEDVTVSTEGLTLQSTSLHDAGIEGTVVVSANDVTVDGFTITDFSQIPTPDWAGIYVPSGTGVVIANNLIDGSAIDPVANLTVGIHTLYGASAEITAQDNTITNVRMGIYNQGAEMLITGNTIDGATSTNPHCGIGVDTSLGTEIYENDIRYNSIGIEVFQEGVVAHYNNICGNTEYGLWAAPGVYVDATNNYWCHPSGPHASPGYGDPVSGDVLYDPWLLEPLLPEEELPTTFDKTLSLNIGWTLVSTDSWISAASVVGEGVILAVNYIPGEGWSEVTPAALVPVDAIYLKMVEGGGLGFDYSDGYPAPSSKDLEAGWNLISSATEGNARDILSPLCYIQVGDEQGVGLATLVSQGDYNQHTGSFTLATLGPSDWNQVLGITELNPFDGYWVYMNAAKNFGVVPD